MAGESLIAALFWVSLAALLYTYAGYPCLVWVASRLAPRRPVIKGSSTPTVSAVLAVWNEDEKLEPRIRDLLAQDYPAGSLEVIIVSDGSTDGTDAVARKLEGERVRFYPLPGHQGKACALNLGVSKSQAEVVVFADARQRFNPDVVRRLAANFADPSVGCVSGRLVFSRDCASDIEAEIQSYWSYESWLRRTESDFDSVIGATGAIYALRREIWRAIPHDTLLDDVLVPMQAARQGYRVVYEHAAVATDRMTPSLEEERRRKIRTLSGTWHLLFNHPWLVSPLSNRLFLQFVSHKLLRLLTPAYLAAIALLPLLMGRYRWVPLALAAGFLLGMVGRPLEHVPVIGLGSRLSRTFILMNYFALVAFCRVMRRGKVSW